MNTISDSSPLILLSKLKRIELLRELYEEVWIPDEVYNEVVVKGKDEGYSDAYEVERNIQEFIRVKELDEEHSNRAEDLKSGLGSGESEALMLALQEEAEMLLADDMEVRKMAKNKGITCRSTLGILLEALKEDIITLESYEECIEDLSNFSWISPEVVSKYLKAGYRRCKE